MKFLAPLSIFLLSATSAFSSQFAALSIFAENDIGFSDRYYTNGIKIQYTQSGRDFWVNYPQFMLLDLVSGGGERRFFQTVSAGQGIYVPQDIDIAAPQPDDRPYAGWLYVNAAAHAATKNSLDSAAIIMGIVGRHSYAQDVQRQWHKMFDFDMPQGWENQLADEFGFVFSYKHSQRVWRGEMGGGFAADALVSGGVDLGNVLTQGYASLLLRAGYALPFSFDAGRVGYCSSTDVRMDDSQAPMRLYAVCGATARFVGYDITLNGNAFADSPYSVSPEWFVFEPVAGLSAACGSFQFDLLLTYRTREYLSQKIGHHTYWSASIKYFF